MSATQYLYKLCQRARNTGSSVISMGKKTSAETTSNLLVMGLYSSELADNNHDERRDAAAYMLTKRWAAAAAAPIHAAIQATVLGNMMLLLLRPASQPGSQEGRQAGGRAAACMSHAHLLCSLTTAQRRPGRRP